MSAPHDLVASFLRPLISLPTASVSPSSMLASAPVAGAAAASGSLGNYPTQLQEQTNWCWAAVSAAVAAHYLTAVWTSQCDIASAMTGLVCCSNAPNNVGSVVSEGGCNNPRDLDGPLSKVGHYGSRLDSTILFSDLGQEINGNNPVGVRIVWNANSAHFIAAIGWSTANGSDWVDISDPAHGFVQTSFADLVNAYQNAGTWANTYYIVGNVPPGGGGAPMNVVGPIAP